VVFGLMFFYQIVFEEKSFLFIPGEHKRDALDPGEKTSQPLFFPALIEITAHPISQVLCLPDIDDPVARVAKEVDTRALRQTINILSTDQEPTPTKGLNSISHPFPSVTRAHRGRREEPTESICCA